MIYLLIILVLSFGVLMVLYVKYVIRTEAQDREDYRAFKERITKERDREK